MHAVVLFQLHSCNAHADYGLSLVLCVKTAPRLVALSVYGSKAAMLMRSSPSKLDSLASTAKLQLWTPLLIESLLLGVCEFLVGRAPLGV